MTDKIDKLEVVSEQAGEPAPRVDFPAPDVAFCPRHLEPLRERWPSGYAVLCLDTLQAMFADTGFQDRFELTEAGIRDLDGGKATAILAELSPLCCYLGEERYKPLIEKAFAVARFSFPPLGTKEKGH